MNKIEHLLTCLSEECGEATQVAAKANRFGIDHVWPEKNETNRRILEREIADILGVVEELGLVIRSEDIAAKRTKLRKMMNLSFELGTLDVQVFCDHQWTPINLSPGFDSQCKKCGVKENFGT